MPDAELKAASLMSPSDWWTSFLSAAEWLSDPYRVARVINVSMGIDQVAAEDVALFELVIQGLLRHRTILVAAVGNRAGTGCYPARLRGVPRVGAFQPGDQACNFSGASLISSCREAMCTRAFLGGYPIVAASRMATGMGRPLAAAHLSALIALLYEAYPSVPPWRIANGRLSLRPKSSAAIKTGGNGGYPSLRGHWKPSARTTGIENPHVRGLGFLSVPCPRLASVD